VETIRHFLLEPSSCCCGAELIIRSRNALSTSPVLARTTTSEHNADDEFVAAAARQRLSTSSTTTAPANKYAVLSATDIWLPKSPGVYRYTVERDKRIFILTVPPTSSEKWARALCVSRQAFFEVQFGVFQESKQ
jgi:hypothetical protein